MTFTPALPSRPPELVETESRRAKIRREREAVEDELRRLNAKAWDESQANVDPLDAAAELLAAGEADANSRTVMPENLDFLRSRLEILRRAEGKLAQRVAKLHERHNRSIASALRPEHKKVTQRIARALVELVAANAEEERVRGRAPGATLPAMNFPNAGRFGCAGGPAQYWREHAKRHGYLVDEGDPEARFPAAAL